MRRPKRQVDIEATLNRVTARLNAHEFIVEFLLAHLLKELKPVERRHLRAEIEKGFDALTIPPANSPEQAVDLSDTAVEYREIVREIFLRADARIEARRKTTIARLRSL